MKFVSKYLCSLLLVLASLSPACAATSQGLGPTPLTYFGIIMHRLDSGTPWPPFQFGSWRFWDAYVGWPDVEPRQGDWQFKRLDLYVMAASSKGVDIVYPLGMTTPWASARPTEKSGYKPGYAAEPKDLETWRNYVHTIATRYKGKIKYYEVWNEPSDKTYFSGDPDVMVNMLRIAYETIKQIDPAAQIIAPGVTGVGKHLAYLDDLLSRGAKNYIDIVGHHFYVPNGDPEDMVPLIRAVRKIMQKHGLENKPLWNTETGWWIGNTDGTPDHPMVTKGGWKKFDAGDGGGSLIARALLLARSEGVERFFWYSWDNNYGLGMRNPTSGTPKEIANYFDQIVTEMRGWTLEPCFKNASTWVCKLERQGGAVKWIVWSSTNQLQWPIPLDMKVSRSSQLGQVNDRVISDRIVTIGHMPIVIY